MVRGGEVQSSKLWSGPVRSASLNSGVGFDKRPSKDERCRNLVISAAQLLTAPLSRKPGGAAQVATEEDGTATTWLLEKKQIHGFMMRGATSNPETLTAIRFYMDTMLKFFEEHMK